MIFKNSIELAGLLFVLQSWQKNDAVGVYHSDVFAGRTAFRGLVL
jgi:hypothetical protein